MGTFDPVKGHLSRYKPLILLPFQTLKIFKIFKKNDDVRANGHKPAAAVFLFTSYELVAGFVNWPKLLQFLGET
jgi:hypothetical protein